MFLFASISIGVISLLILAVVVTTKKEFRKMDEHPEQFPHHFSEEPKGH